jgi:hypothetical protein
MDMEEEGVFDDAVLVSLRTSMDMVIVVVTQQIAPSEAPAVVVKTSEQRVHARNRDGHTDDTLRIKSNNYLTT